VSGIAFYHQKIWALTEKERRIYQNMDPILLNLYTLLNINNPDISFEVVQMTQRTTNSDSMMHANLPLYLAFPSTA
jgi:hypothetical protein